MKNKLENNNQPEILASLRQRAEARLTLSSRSDSIPDNLQDVQRLLAELHIHQIELELQNDELRQSQAHLAIEREKFADLFNFAPVAYFTLDKDDVIVELNQAAADLLRHQPKYLIHRPIAPYLTAESLQLFYFTRLRAKETLCAETCELSIRHRGGSLAIVEARTLFLDKKDNEQLLWRTIMTDITERRKIEDALRASEEKYRKLAEELEARVLERTTEALELYENAPCGYNSLDSSGQIVLINQTQLKWMGYSREELVGKPIAQFLSPGSQAQFKNSFKDFIAHGWMHDMEAELIRKDGSILPVLINSTAIYDQAGNYSISRATLIDNTELKKTADALRASEMRLNFLVSNSPALLYSTGLWPDFPITFISNSVENLMGYPQEQFQQDPKLHHHLIHPDDLNQGLSITQKLMESGQAAWEQRLQHSDGCYYWYSGEMNLKFDENGQPHEVIGYAINVDAKKKAELALAEKEANLRLSRDELMAAYTALEKASRTKTDFLANMSHELRTPLNGILGPAEILLDGYKGPLNENQQRLVHTIDASGQHLLNLINDLLDISKIEAGKMETHPETIIITDICQASLAFIYELATRKNIQVEFKPDPVISTIQADPVRLKQILTNLLSNAVKFTPSNGKVALTILADQERRCIDFTVSDTGIGIASDDLERLFAPFTQVDTSLTRPHDGSGLGLALVKHLTEMHGGSVSVSSEVGKGSQFTISLPWIKDAASQVEPGILAEAEPATSAIQTAPAPACILLAEDMETNLVTIGDFLKELGYSLLLARNGKEALEQAEKNSPDAILMDIQMPEMNGLEAIRALRANPRFASTPIVALTALAMDGDKERCLEAGANYYISKPITMKKLAELIHNIIPKKE